MFGLLKKKLSNFGDKLKHNLDKKTKEVEESPREKEINTKEIENKTLQKKEEIITEKPIQEKETLIEKPQKKEKQKLTKEDREKAIFEEIQREIEKEDKDALETIQKEEILEDQTEKEILSKELINKLENIEEEKDTGSSDKEKVEEDPFEEEEAEGKEIEEEKVFEKPRDIEVKKVDEDKRELRARVGKTGRLKGFFSGKVEIHEGDVTELLEELELSLLESDVEQDAAQEITTKIKERIVGQKLSIKNLDNFLKELIKEILEEMMTTQKINLLEEIKKAKKPYKILMLGPNGAGKTTSIAKLTYYFQKNKLTSIWAASDTFRSGAIDQLQEHADKLNVKVIKQNYGADPAAVAFDAVKSAEANKIDVVLIDSAGRQETNKNLMEELKKIERVARPNLKIYVGEAYTGQGLIDMAKEFDEMVGIDGFILTKMDTDAKGGTTISLLYTLKKPILYIGTGQEYTDFEEFTPKYIINRII